jgi:hypothetical protein
VHGTRLAPLIVLGCMAGWLVGCGFGSPVGGSATPTPASQEANGLSVTLADDGRTISMHVGERFLLNLGEGFDWTVLPDDPAIVSRVPNILTIRGSQGLYEAHKTGRTSLTATGDPTCRQATPPCYAPSRLFRLEVVVQ